jgi:hypothetical protein
MDLFTYDTYQDVRNNLFKYSAPCLAIMGFFCFFFVLPPSEQKCITSIFEFISKVQPWKEILGTGIGFSLFVGIAFLLTEIFQVHDKFYDKYIIKWRQRYAIDFILPRLIQPFSSSLNYRFYEEVEIRTGEFQKELFYPFVGDRDLKIPKNKLVRFYEVVTFYWLTQINEIVLLLAGIMVIFYRWMGPDDLQYRTSLLTSGIIIAVVFLLNRCLAHATLSKVRSATADEIRSIHDQTALVDELKSRLKSLCENYKIPFREAA